MFKHHAKQLLVIVYDLLSFFCFYAKQLIITLLQCIHRRVYYTSVGIQKKSGDEFLVEM